jgi:enhancing lycopene biosynthesis protein 2
MDTHLTAAYGCFVHNERMNEVCINERTGETTVNIRNYFVRSNKISFGGTNLCTNEAILAAG